MIAMQEYGLREPEFIDMEITFRINLYRMAEEECLSVLKTDQDTDQSNQSTDQDIDQISIKENWSEAEFTDKENEDFIKKYNLPKELLNAENKNMIHGFTASILVKEKYNFTEDMVLAIRYHTTGYPNMDLLAKIVYLADKIEKGKDYPGIEEERLIAYQNIDKAIILCLKNQIKHLKEKNKVINKMGYETLQFLETDMTH